MKRTSTSMRTAGVFLAACLALPCIAWSAGPNPVTGGQSLENPDPIASTLPPSVALTLIDFESIAVFTPTGAGDIVPVPGSVVTTEFANVGVVFGKPGSSAGVANVRDSLAPSSGLNSVAGLNAAGIIPGAGGGGGLGDIFFSFVEPGTATPATADMVSFTIGDAGGDNDIFQIRSYDLADALIDTQNVQGISRFLVTINVPGIHRVEVDFTGNFGYSLDDLSFNLAPVLVPVSLDVRPTSCPNPLNPKSKGVLPVAILGTASFDVQDIDVSTLLLEGVAPIRYAYQDVTTPVTDGEPCECTTLGPDGYVDLTLKFSTQDIVAALGAVSVGDVIELTITGELSDGTAIEGTDCVIIRGRTEELTLEPAEDTAIDDGDEAVPGSTVRKAEGVTWGMLKARYANPGE